MKRVFPVSKSIFIWREIGEFSSAITEIMTELT